MHDGEVPSVNNVKKSEQKNNHKRTVLAFGGNIVLLIG